MLPESHPSLSSIETSVGGWENTVPSVLGRVDSLGASAPTQGHPEPRSSTCGVPTPSEGIGQALSAEPSNRLPASVKELDLETDGTRCPRHLVQRTLVETEISCVGREKCLSVKQPVTGVTLLGE